MSRGGEGKAGVSCMDGCLIKCSNIYPDASGKKICSTLQYENIALLGSNLGFTNLDPVARLNYECDDIGVDAIEAGAALGVAIDMGLGKWDDLEGCMAMMKEIRNNTLLGKVLGHGAQVTGDVLGSRRIPAAKGQVVRGLRSPRPQRQRRDLRHVPHGRRPYRRQLFRVPRRGESAGDRTSRGSCPRSRNTRCARWTAWGSASSPVPPCSRIPAGCRRWSMPF